MTKLNTMYKGVVNSPETYLKENLAAEGAVIYVADGSVFGELPNLAVIGEDQTAETILVKVKRSDGGYDVDRAVEGQKKDWQKATVIARTFTNYDYQQLIDNINALNEDKVGKVEGKGLSTKDYTAAEQTKLKDIEEKATKTEIINDLTSGGVDKALSAEQGKVLFQNVDDGKLQIANAIIDKGQSGVSNNSTFQELANAINNIESETKSTIDGTPFIMSSNEDLKTFVKNNKNKLVTLPNIFNTSNVTNLFSAFENCIYLETFPKLDYSRVTTFKFAFSGCKKLKTIPTILAPNLTITEGMFFNCISITEISYFDTSKVTKMSGMFANCINLEIVPNFNTENVIGTSSMFKNCSKLKFVPKFDMGKIQKFDGMFEGCTSLDIVRMRAAGWEERFLQTAPNYR